MKLEPIVLSLLDTDLYKFNMDQVIFHKHTDLSGEYYFRCRNEGVIFTREMFEEINAQIDHLCTLTFTKEELDYLRSIRFIKSDYVEFLRLWRPIRDYVETALHEDGTLDIVVRGPLFSAMQFEIYLLEIVNEVYFRMKYDYAVLRASAEERLNRKIADFQAGKYTFQFAEFGSRRRLSREWEEVVVRRLSQETKNCVGTSNVYFAMKYGIKPIGTYAHEFVQMYLRGLPGLRGRQGSRYRPELLRRIPEPCPPLRGRALRQGSRIPRGHDFRSGGKDRLRLCGQVLRGAGHPGRQHGKGAPRRWLRGCEEDHRSAPGRHGRRAQGVRHLPVHRRAAPR